MTEIAVLTPAADDPAYGSHWPKVLERLSIALALRGLTTRPMAWTEHARDGADLAGFPLVLPVLTWGYYERHDLWLTATDAWAEAGVRLANPASVLNWNSDKSYLRRLEAGGVAIPPTLWTDGVEVDGVEVDGVEAAFDRFGTDTLIVKPTVSGGAWKTIKLRRDQALAGAPGGPTMIQPFLPDLATAGELSLLFFSGRLSHAVVKRAAPGEFRIQSQYGGQYAFVEQPPSEALDLAHNVLAAIEEDLLYARIDMVEHEGRWLLMEAELIEPDFYLAEAPDKGLAFAQAARALVDAA